MDSNRFGKRFFSPSISYICQKWVSARLFLLTTFVTNSHFILFYHVTFESNSTLEISAHGNFTFANLERLNELRKKQMSLCVPNQEWYQMFIENIWIYIDMSIIFVIPFLTMNLSLLFICFKVKKSNENYAGIQIDYGHKLNNDIYERKINRNKRVILKLFLINVYFLISVFPYFIFLVFFQRKLENLKNILLCLFYSNNAMNIFHYGLTCGRFRDELRKVNVCLKVKQTKNMAQNYESQTTCRERSIINNREDEDML